MDVIQFHHIGLPTEQSHPGEIAYPSMKLWATSPDANPNRAEWLRFDLDSPYRDTPLARMPHVAFMVDDLDRRLDGKEVVLGPLEVAKNFRVAYFLENGLLVEYMEGTP